MLRFLGILLPALCGAALVWFMVPAGGGRTADVSANESRITAEEKKALSTAVRILVGSPQDVFGKRLAIITPDNQLTREDLEGADAKFLAKAYTECRVVLSPEMYRQYLESIGEAPDGGEAAQPDEAQMKICSVLVGVFSDVFQENS